MGFTYIGPYIGYASQIHTRRKYRWAYLHCYTAHAEIFGPNIVRYSSHILQTEDTA